MLSPSDCQLSSKQQPLVCPKLHESDPLLSLVKALTLHVDDKAFENEVTNA